MDTEGLSVLVVDDAPAVKDAFGSHQRIADAIFDLVTREDGGRAIALVGSWESGKSTVVTLLSNRAREQSKDSKIPSESAEVFIFDAWAHEGDPLRRSFLERLIAALQAKGWVDEARWNKKLRQLANRQKEIVTTSSPVFGKLGVAMIFFLYLAPLGIAISAGSHNFWHKYGIFWAGAVLYLTPIVLAFVHWVRTRKSADASQLFNLMGLISNKTTQRTESETLEAPDPTSVEFQEIFRQLAAEALDAERSPHRKLLLVIDNLDRVETEHALRLWSSMSTFLIYPSPNPPEWSKQVWTLVPFDQSGIERMWNTETGQSVAETFLAKTFQIRFNVPAPVLSDWTSFLRDQLKAAFPNSDEQVFYAISRIFFVLRPKQEPPTPREIKAYVNQIGATYRSQPENIPLPVHALFASLVKTGGWKPGQEIRAKDELQSYLEADWEQGLTALFYNVPKDKALQVTFGADVERYLTEGNSKDFAEFAKKPGVDNVTLQVVAIRSTTWVQAEPFRIGRAALACEAVLDQNTLVWDEVWARLGAAARRAADWPALDRASGRGLALLVRRWQRRDLTKGLIENLSKTQLDSLQTDSRKLWTEGALEVVKGIIDAGQKEIVQDFFRLGPTPQAYLQQMKTLTEIEEHEDLVRFFRPACDPGDVLRTMVNSVNQNAFATFEKSVGPIMSTDETWDWDSLTQAINVRIHQPTSHPNEIGAMLDALLRLRTKVDSANAALRSCAQNGWIFHHLNVSQQGNHTDPIAMCLLVIMIFNPESTGSPQPGVAPQGRLVYQRYMASPHQVAPVFSALVSRAADLPIAKELIERRGSSIAHAAVSALLNALAVGPGAQKFFSPAVIAEQFEKLSSALEAQALSNVLASATLQDDLILYLINHPFAAPLSGLYRTLLESKHDPRLEGHVRQGLRALSTEGSSEAFSTNPDLIRIVTSTQGFTEPLDLDFHFGDALTAIADHAFLGTAPGALTPEQCEKILMLSNVEQREIFNRHIADKIANSHSDMKIFLRYFGPATEDCSFLTAVSETFVREGLPKILGREDSVEIDWAIQVLKKCPQILIECEKSSLQSLKSRVAERSNEDAPDALRPGLQELAKILSARRGLR